MLKPNPNLLADNLAAGYGAPILYLPMKDAATAHINEGTGGNFTPNGTYATSNRGANQDNCVASYFDGVADYLSRTLTAFSTNYFTVSFNFRLATSQANDTFLCFKNTSLTTSQVNIYQTGYIRVILRDSAQVAIGQWIGNSGMFTNSSLHTLNISVLNTLSTSNIGIKVILDGKDITSLGTQYPENAGSFYANTLNIMENGGFYIKGNIGELYFNTTYTDLATSNPFWDSVENKPVPVRKVIADTGVTPLIAMPLDASNAGKNYGTGGDFTVNSGPYVGARGASEVWQRTAKFDGSTGYLSRGALTGAVDSKTFSIVIVFNQNSNAVDYVLTAIENASNVVRLRIAKKSTNELDIRAYSSAGASLIQANTIDTFTSGITYIVQICIDLTDTAKRFIYVNNTNQAMNWSTYTNDFINVSAQNVYIAKGTGLSLLNGTEAMCYFTTDYIDFSQEVNRLKFVDGLGYPLDLAKQIESGAIPKPLIYLPFDDTANLGKNLGTGGNFTVNGTVTAGADVLG